MISASIKEKEMRRFSVFVLCFFVMFASKKILADKADLYSKNSVMNSIEELSTQAIKCQFVFEQLHTIEVAKIVKEESNSNVRIRDKNGFMHIGTLSNDKKTLETTSIDTGTVWSLGNKMIIETLNAKGTIRMCFVRDGKELIYRQWAEWNTDSPMVVPMPQYDNADKFLPVRGLNFLENSNKTFFANAYSLLEDNSDHCVIGNHGDDMLQFTFRKGVVPLLESWTAKSPDGSTVHRTYSDFVLLNGVEVPSGFLEVASNENDVLDTRSQHSMAWEVIDVNKFEEEFAKFKKEVSSEPEKTLNLKIMDASEYEKYQKNTASEPKDPS
jgi:hypothetical protein